MCTLPGPQVSVTGAVTSRAVSRRAISDAPVIHAWATHVGTSSLGKLIDFDDIDS